MSEKLVICHTELKDNEAETFFAALRQLMSEPTEPRLFELFQGELSRHFLEAGLAGFVYGVYQKQRRRVPDLPEPPRAFRAAYFQNMRKNHMLLSECRRIFQRADRLNILAVQGIAHLIATYDDPGSRELQDMDFLVSEEDMPPFIELLFDLGYVVKEDQAVFSCDYDGHVELQKMIGSVRVLVDVSSCTRLPVHLMTDFFRKHLTDILNHGRTTPGGIGVPHTSDLALLTLLNLERKEYTAVKGLVDFAVMLRRAANPMDWQRFNDLLDEPGARRIVGRQLNFCRQGLGAEVPPRLGARLSKGAGFAVDGWLSFFMDPQIIMTKRGRSLNNSGKAPSFRSFCLGLARRMTSYDFPNREKKWLHLIFTDAELVIDYFYRVHHPAARLLLRYLVNPLMVISGYLLAQAVFLAGGFYFHHHYRQKNRALGAQVPSTAPLLFDKRKVV